MSRAGGNKKRFGYLAAAEEREELPAIREPEEAETNAGGGLQRRDSGEGLGDTRQGSKTPRHKPAVQQLASVPKGKGRMKQERSQLNVRIPTALKRQASAKAILEGKDIGEVVEGLLRKYLER